VSAIYFPVCKQRTPDERATVPAPNGYRGECLATGGELKTVSFRSWPEAVSGLGSCFFEIDFNPIRAVQPMARVTLRITSDKM
jgi:hypothetical protein